MPTRWEPRHTAEGGEFIRAGEWEIKGLEEYMKLTDIFRVEIFLKNKQMVCALHIYRRLEGGEKVCEVHILKSNMWS